MILLNFSYSTKFDDFKHVLNLKRYFFSKRKSIKKALGMSGLRFYLFKELIYVAHK